MKSCKKRNVALDIVRCVALFCVVAVHFFLNSGFYGEIVVGRRMFIMVLMRSFFMICVPMFIVLSGYLVCNKRLERSYFGKIGKTIGIYVLASLCCILYKAVRLHEQFTFISVVKEILAFSGAPYSWYIEMYIGLYMMIPFLNILYNNIETKRAKQGLILIMLLLTAAPSMTNIYQIMDLDWLLHPSSSAHYDKLLPEWWISIYPLTYYFIGCYLNEYPPQIKRITNIALIVLLAIVAGTHNYYRSYNMTFIWGRWQDWGAIANVLQTGLVFNFITQLNFDHAGAKTKTILAKMSDWSLGAYLLSWIFDREFYDLLYERQSVMNLRLEYFIIIVPAVYLCSLLLSAVINLLYRGMAYIFAWLQKKIRIYNSAVGTGR